MSFEVHHGLDASGREVELQQQRASAPARSTQSDRWLRQPSFPVRSPSLKDGGPAPNEAQRRPRRPKAQYAQLTLVLREGEKWSEDSGEFDLRSNCHVFAAARAAQHQLSMPATKPIHYQLIVNDDPRQTFSTQRWRASSLADLGICAGNRVSISVHPECWRSGDGDGGAGSADEGEADEASYTLGPAPRVLRPRPCALGPAPCVLRPSPCAPRPAPCSLQPTCCSPQPATCLQPAACSLQPAACSLQLVAHASMAAVDGGPRCAP